MNADECVKLNIDAILTSARDVGKLEISAAFTSENELRIFIEEES
jgi:hypothetical protein